MEPSIPSTGWPLPPLAVSPGSNTLLPTCVPCTSCTVAMRWACAGSPQSASNAMIRAAPRNKRLAWSRGASMETPTALFERKDPFKQCLEIGVGNVVGRHRNRAPDAAAALLDFLLEP